MCFGFPVTGELLAQLKNELAQFRHDVAKTAVRNEQDKKIMFKNLADLEERLEDTRIRLQNIMTSCDHTETTVHDDLQPSAKFTKGHLQEVGQNIINLHGNVKKNDKEVKQKLFEMQEVTDMSQFAPIKGMLDSIHIGLQKVHDLEKRLEDAKIRLVDIMTSCNDTQTTLHDGIKPEVTESLLQVRKVNNRLVDLKGNVETHDADIKRKLEDQHGVNLTQFPPLRQMLDTIQECLKRMEEKEEPPITAQMFTQTASVETCSMASQSPSLTREHSLESFTSFATTSSSREHSPPSSPRVSRIPKPGSSGTSTPTRVQHKTSAKTEAEALQSGVRAKIKKLETKTVKKPERPARWQH